MRNLLSILDKHHFPLLHNGVNRQIQHSVILCLLISLTACAHNSKQMAQAPLDHAALDDQFTVQLLGINDFHGQITELDQHGGMYQLSRHLLHAISSTSEQSFILHAGDHVGASPAESALLQDEPAIDFLNIVQNYCINKPSPSCEVIGAAGNHEFDEGSDEMLRLFNGGNHKNGPFIHPNWAGSNYHTLGANIRDASTNELILLPYVVREVNNIPIGFIGITLDITPEMVIPGIVDNLVFQDQAKIVSDYTSKLQAQGVEAIVVIVHDGSSDDYYEGPTSAMGDIKLDSRFGRFIKALPNAVDVLVTGHSHRFTNAYVTNNAGKTFLVTQAFSSGRAYSDISITLSKHSKDIVEATADVIMTNTQHDLSLSVQAQKVLDDITQLKSAAIQYSKGVTEQIIGTYTAQENDIPLGQFLADSHMFALNADLAIMNRGGVRAELNQGDVSWGDLFSIQPFSNPLITRKYSGEQLSTLISDRNHWSSNVIMDDSGNITINGQKITSNKDYIVAGNAFILNTDTFKIGDLVSIEGMDIDATIAYIKTLGAQFSLSPQSF